MVDKLVITIIGISKDSFHKYLDILANSKVQEVKILYSESEKEIYNSLLKLYQINENFLHGKLIGQSFSWESFCNKYLRSEMDIYRISNFIPNAMLKTLRLEAMKSDLIILEIKNLSTLLLACAMGILEINYVLAVSSSILLFPTYIQLMPVALKHAKTVVVPSLDLVRIISPNQSVIEEQNKFIIADVDWRSKFIYNRYLKEFRPKKLSTLFKKTHLCIVSPLVVCEKSDEPLSILSYYAESIERFLKAGFVVCLYTNNIIKSLSEKNYERNNKYNLIFQKFKNNFSIYDLSRKLNYPEFYYEISQYDFALIQAFNVEINDVSYLFIPRVYYDYQMAKLQSIVSKKSLNKAKHKFPNSDLIFFDDPKDILNYQNYLKNNNFPEPTNFYHDFVEEIFRYFYY